MVFSPFPPKDTHAVGEGDRRRDSKAARNGGLRKWLSMKVGTSHRQNRQASISPPASGARYSVAGLPDGSRHKASRNTAAQAHSRLSLPASHQLDKRTEVPQSTTEYGSGSSPSWTSATAALVAGLAPTPPPTIEEDDDDDVCSKDTTPSPPPRAERMQARARPKSQLPLRKRSLIYAMYCTAQPDDAPVAAAESPQLEEIPASMNSCSPVPMPGGRMPSVGSSRESQRPHEGQRQQSVSEMSIGFVVVDVPEHLAAAAAAARRQRDSCGSEVSVDTTMSNGSGSSGRSSFVEHQEVESAAFLCSGRYAPRLSTIERAQDGRVLLKPSADELSDHDSGDTSTADTSPGVRDVNTKGGGLAPKASSDGGEEDPFAVVEAGQQQACCVDDFPPIPRRSLHGRSPRKPVNSLLLINASRISQDGVSELPAVTGPCAPTTAAITPPASPDKSSTEEASTSADTAVSSAKDPEEQHATLDPSDTAVPRPDSGNDGCHLPSVPKATPLGSSSSPDSKQVGGCQSTTALNPEFSPPFDHGRLLAACQHRSYDSITRAVECSPSEGNPLLGSVSGVDPPCADPDTPFSDSKSSSSSSSGSGDTRARAHAFCDESRPQSQWDPDGEDLEDMTLANVVAMDSDSAHCPEELLPASRARRLTAVLARAAQLDGLRHFRKTRALEHSEAHVTETARRSSSSSTSCPALSKTGPARKRRASRKLFRFNELVAVYETWNSEEYNRRGLPSTKLDADLIERIKQELNEYKIYEMRVHEGSRSNTHFIY